MANKKKTTTPKAKEAEKQSVILSSLPQNIMKIGGHVEEDKNIYISQAAYKAIHNFTKDKLENESGGMLMGYTLEGAGKTNIIIDGFIEGKHSEATPTTLKFTHETWEYVHAEADKKYPDYKIIGWIHTHPSFGIFLSEYDKFIQQNFFNGENQVAYVVDPIQKTEGFYFWINGKIEKCNGFYIYDKTGTPIVIESEQPEEEKTASSAHIVPQKKSWKDYLLVATSILMVIMLFITLSLSGKLSDLENDTNKIISEQESAETYISSLLSEISTLKQKLNAAQTDIDSLQTALEEANTAIGDVQTSVGDVQTSIGNVQDAVDDMQTSIDNNNQTAQDSKYNCLIIFLNYDGSVISETEYKFGTKITPPATPSKPSDNTYNYEFAGWDETPNLALGNTIYKATYTPVLREYTVKFVDVEGNTISEAKYHYGETVNVPTYTATKESEEPNSYNYVMKWDKTIATVADDATYTAVFEKEYIEYTVRFVRDDGSLIEEKTYHYNDTITMADPTKESTDTHTYAFTGWDKEFAPVTENTEYVASFEATPIPATPEGEGEEINGGS